jgi:hypothetical protein
MTTEPYTLSPQFFVIRDTPQHIDRHIRVGDYFAHLATLVGFLEEALSAPHEITDSHHKLVKELRQDLRYVQANYHVIERPIEDTQTIHPSGNLLNRALTT